MDKNIVLEWLEKSKKDGNYVAYFDDSIEDVCLDGMFNLQDLLESIWHDGWNSGNCK